ncbi:hypothetical protein P152DRAFT_209715 [Eremomyces bilateralis CBS 781.70]|uniref:Secreted protein n=1 Tax=Eremomyces bilateralis CBS 781.70 TaxID=1392243 RepID=A0A6G1FSY2_9PEZI|nr:uncharacterized protein P152DRAFT_209715 [Eremomyces bilateralis CBS 781.70]KAF1808792.1 hypothetical protein P152DRAFT_209715 [Eremomyces bilateralis CBS 781.70]
MPRQAMLFILGLDLRSATTTAPTWQSASVHSCTIHPTSNLLGSSILRARQFPGNSRSCAAVLPASIGLAVGSLYDSGFGRPLMDIGSCRVELIYIRKTKASRIQESRSLDH